MVRTVFAYLLGASLLDVVLGVEVSSIRVVGAFLLVYAAVVGAVGLRRPVNRRAAMVVIGGNVLWVAPRDDLVLLGRHDAS